MLYFKNTELADKYHVSLGTVRNWIEASQNNKLNLTLHSTDTRDYIANTATNISVIEELVESRKKFRPGHTVKRLTPKSEFYSIYNQDQVYDIVTTLEVRREISRKYSYFDGGAYHWDEYIQRMEDEDLPSNLTMTKELFSRNEGYIDDLMGKYKKVNVVDVGVGNGLPTRGLIAHLLEQKKLGRYIAIDISPEMLKIAEENIKKWFGNKVHFEGHALDITKHQFSSILAEDYIHNSLKHTGNLILFLGGTLQNFRKRDIPLQVINGSMGANDILIHTQKLDSETSRRYFDFNRKPGSQALPSVHRLVVDLLNIDPSLYEVEVGYDERKKERYEQIRMKTSIEIKFDFDDGERILSLDRGESVLLWRASQDSALEIMRKLDINDFYVLHSSQTEDQEYIMTISKVKSS